MRTRCGPLTAFAATFAVEMSASSVRDVIQRVAETVMPLPETRFGASASAAFGAPSSNRPRTTTSARARGPTNIERLPFARTRRGTVQRTFAFIKKQAHAVRRTPPCGIAHTCRSRVIRPPGGVLSGHDHEDHHPAGGGSRHHREALLRRLGGW